MDKLLERCRFADGQLGTGRSPSQVLTYAQSGGKSRQFMTLVANELFHSLGGAPPTGGYIRRFHLNDSSDTAGEALSAYRQID